MGGTRQKKAWCSARHNTGRGWLGLGDGVDGMRTKKKPLSVRLSGLKRDAPSLL
jgi:hypothetical protein